MEVKGRSRSLYPYSQKEIGEELADVAVWVLLMSHDLGIDIKKAIIKKNTKEQA